jgi:H+/Cl- antiporter ClcA/CBS domain-containing protein
MTLTSAPKGLMQPKLPAPSEPASRFTHLLNRLQPTPETVVLLLAVVIGTAAGAGVIVFRSLIHLIHTVMLTEVSGRLSVWGHWTLALIPLLGGAMIGLMRWRIRDFGPSLSALIETVEGGRELLPLKPVSKMIAASISLGTGASLGPEGPSVEIGANFSLLLGQVLQVSRERQRLLLSAGAAAGLAAGFNAPIAGVFFALEVVLGTTFAASAVSVVLLASVVAAWIAQIGLGIKPAFALPAYEVRSLLELPLYVGLGLLASLISLLYVRSLSFSRRSFQGQIPGLSWLGRIPRPLHPVIGGATIGLMALHLPQILGVGYETIESILQDVQFSLRLVLAILVVKLVMTAISYGSGFIGGIFAPALFLGASLGSSYGKILAIALPSLHPYMASPPAYAMVGMAAVLASSVRAPLTSILLLFELTRDYRIVLPLMAAVGLSSWLIERWQPRTAEPRHEQQALKPELQPATEVLPPLMVAEVMHALPLQLSADLPLGEAGLALIEHRCRSALVMETNQQLLGIITLQDVNRLMARAEESSETGNLTSQPIRNLCTVEVLYAYEDELIAEAVSRMAARGLQQLPVVTRDVPPRVVGLLTREDITLAQALLRTKEALHHHLSNSSNAQSANSQPLPVPIASEPLSERLADADLANVSEVEQSHPAKPLPLCSAKSHSA